MARGKFITLEGGEGAGKSTQARLLAERLARAGHRTLITREPGGSEKAEKIRDILLSGKAAKYGPFAEALLFFLARDDHLEKTIRPALDDGVWVICDRFMDSTRAYQGAGGGLSPDIVSALETVIVGETVPDLTLILDLPPEKGLQRVRGRLQQSGGQVDRFEDMALAFHRRLRQGFLDIAAREPERCVVIDADQAPDRVAQAIWQAVRQRLNP